MWLPPSTAVHCVVSVLVLWVIHETWHIGHADIVLEIFNSCSPNRWVWYSPFPGITSTKLINLTSPSVSLTAGIVGCHVTGLTFVLPANLCCYSLYFTQWKVVDSSKCQVSLWVLQSKRKCCFFLVLFCVLFRLTFNNHKEIHRNPSQKRQRDQFFLPQKPQNETFLPEIKGNLLGWAAVARPRFITK